VILIAEMARSEASENGGVSVLVELADRRLSSVLAELHRTSAIAGYKHIFPAEASPPSPDEVRAEWERWLGRDWDHGLRAFVAEDIDVVGVVLAGPDASDPTVGHLARLYVTPHRWGEGIGRLLHDTAVAYLRATGFSEATLWVLEKNHRARSWYERLGWRATGQRKTVYAPAGIDDLGYRLPL
jgi:GNAT superfamily N-acetyltransferase